MSMRKCERLNQNEPGQVAPEDALSEPHAPEMVTSAQLTYQLLCTIRQFNIFDEKAHYFGGDQPLYTAEIHVLSCIGGRRGLCASDVAREMGVTRGAVSQILKKLEKKGYLVKEADPGNKLRFLLGLSEKGIRAYRKHLEYHRYLDAMIGELTGQSDGRSRDIIYDFLSSLEKRLLPVSATDGIKSGMVPDEEEMKRQLEEETG